ncbi:MAG: methionyl-tRNA formyltransferase [Chloroflexi bacterium]|nr:methionyl-tRNA formyltransferase [Chloroflexota bacterium]
MNTRIVFIGSPDFAVPILRALADNYPIAGVVTQPDRPAGRGRKLTPPPVRILARELGIPTVQPQRLRGDPEALTQLRAWNPDVIVVAAFGQILRPNVLDLPPHGCLNVHASLLPRWRGAAPINAAILHGDTQTGCTVMKMTAGLDTGPIISQRATPIHPDDTAGALFTRLAQLGADLLIETLPRYLSGTLTPQPQGDTPTAYAPMLERSDGKLDFSETAEMLARRVRAFHPWPGTFIQWKGSPLKIHRAHKVDAASPGMGIFTTRDGLPAIGTSDGLLVIDELQPAGKKSMQGDVFLRGARGWRMTNGE